MTTFFWKMKVDRLGWTDSHLHPNKRADTHTQLPRSKTSLQISLSHYPAERHGVKARSEKVQRKIDILKWAKQRLN